MCESAVFQPPCVGRRSLLAVFLPLAYAMLAVFLPLVYAMLAVFLPLVHAMLAVFQPLGYVGVVLALYLLV